MFYPLNGLDGFVVVCFSWLTFSDAIFGSFRFRPYRRFFCLYMQIVAWPLSFVQIEILSEQQTVLKTNVEKWPLCF